MKKILLLALLALVMCSKELNANPQNINKGNLRKSIHVTFRSESSYQDQMSDKDMKMLDPSFEHGAFRLTMSFYANAIDIKADKMSVDRSGNDNNKVLETIYRTTIIPSKSTILFHDKSVTVGSTDQEGREMYFGHNHIEDIDVFFLKGVPKYGQIFFCMDPLIGPFMSRIFFNEPEIEEIVKDMEQELARYTWANSNL